MQNYGRVDSDQLAAEVGRSRDALYWWASQLGVTNRPKPKIAKVKGPRKRRSMWTKTQIECLLDNYGRIPDEQLAKMVDKAIVTIHTKYKQVTNQNMSVQLEERTKRDALAYEGQFIRQSLDKWVLLKTRDDDPFIRHHFRL